VYLNFKNYFSCIILSRYCTFIIQSCLCHCLVSNYNLHKFLSESAYYTLFDQFYIQWVVLTLMDLTECKNKNKEINTCHKTKFCNFVTMCFVQLSNHGHGCMDKLNLCFTLVPPNANSLVFSFWSSSIPLDIKKNTTEGLTLTYKRIVASVEDMEH